ncbi:MAG: hypothetical protein BWY72_02016 [Bacteroidetes bacterium ADurb.Bin416]|nr:MAG: hypothetical protein BWY72_02016 [Bacteroidetes bacterium ADurb.Bin416]
MGVAAKITDTDITHILTDLVPGVDAIDRNVVANDGKRQQRCFSLTVYTDGNLGPFFTPETLHDIITGKALSCEEAIFNGHDAVSGQQAHPLGWTALDHGCDEDCIVQQPELHTNATKTTFHLNVRKLAFLCRHVHRMRIQLPEYIRDEVFRNLCQIEAVHVFVIDKPQQGAQLVQIG